MIRAAPRFKKIDTQDARAAICATPSTDTCVIDVRAAE
jgi:hypothetical protein